MLRGEPARLRARVEEVRALAAATIRRDPCRYFTRRHRPAEQVPLQLVADLAAKQSRLVGQLDAFRDAANCRACA